MKVGVLGYKGRMGQVVMDELTRKGHQAIALSQENLEKQLRECEGVIEFSSSSGVKLLLENAHCPLVLASTGLSEDLKKQIVEKSCQIPIFYTSNYSLGLFKLMLMLKQASLDPSSGVIVETHHQHKKDAPSGTALMLHEFLGFSNEIISHREGEVFGIHEIKYQLGNEVLTFKHEALNRGLFAHGSVEALNFLMSVAPGLYSMNDLHHFLNR
jgi:4-hydroxy-tetrahydrodipicolinate reductase